jgi:hypothetical protein
MQGGEMSLDLEIWRLGRGMRRLGSSSAHRRRWTDISILGNSGAGRVSNKKRTSEARLGREKGSSKDLKLRN